jgi:hypothetical protein
MRHFRFSIRGLMVVIVLLCVSIAALRFPTPLWANFLFSLTVAALTLAVPAAIYRRGEQRAFWVGFAICGWVYFMLALSPWSPREAGFQLATTTILDLMSPHIVPKNFPPSKLYRGFNPQIAPFEPTPWQVWNMPDDPPANRYSVGYVSITSPELYLRIGHAFFCMLIAFLGGGIVRYQAATCEEPPATERRS